MSSKGYTVVSSGQDYSYVGEPGEIVEDKRLTIVFIGFFYIAPGCAAITFPTFGNFKYKTSDLFSGNLQITSGSTHIANMRRRRYEIMQAIVEVLTVKDEASILVKKDFWSFWWKAVWRSYQCKQHQVETYRFDWQGTNPVSIHAFAKGNLTAIIKGNAFLVTKFTVMDPKEVKTYATIAMPAFAIGFDYNVAVNDESDDDGIKGDFYPSLIAALVGMKTTGKH